MNAKITRCRAGDEHHVSLENTTQYSFILLLKTTLTGWAHDKAAACLRDGRKTKGHLPSVAALSPMLRHSVSNTIFHFIRADKWQRCWPIRQQTVQNRPALPGKHTLKSIRRALKITAIPSKPTKHTMEKCTATATHLVSTRALQKIEKRLGTGEQRLAYKTDETERWCSLHEWLAGVFKDTSLTAKRPSEAFLIQYCWRALSLESTLSWLCGCCSSANENVTMMDSWSQR